MANYCKKCRMPYSAGHYMYLAQDGDRLLAAGLFLVGSEEVSILFYEAEDPNDAYLLDGILRAGFNYANQHGLEQGVISEEFRRQHRVLLDQLNYPIQTKFNISNLFAKYKNCGNL